MLYYPNFFIGFLIIFPIVRVTHLFTADFFFLFTLELYSILLFFSWKKYVLSQKKGMQKSFSAFSSKLFFWKNWSQYHIYTLEFLKMWYGKTRVTSYELKALKHDLKLKSASSNPRVTSSNSRVTRSNPWVTSSNPWVTSSNLRVTGWNPRIIKSMRTQVNRLKISSFPKMINPELFGWGSKH